MFDIHLTEIMEKTRVYKSTTLKSRLGYEHLLNNQNTQLLGVKLNFNSMFKRVLALWSLPVIESKIRLINNTNYCIRNKTIPSYTHRSTCVYII